MIICVQKKRKKVIYFCVNPCDLWANNNKKQVDGN